MTSPVVLQQHIPVYAMGGIQEFVDSVVGSQGAPRWYSFLAQRGNRGVDDVRRLAEDSMGKANRSG